MAAHTWLESSLRRSAGLGLEVLERASRRSMDWTNSATSRTPTVTHDDSQPSVKRINTELDEAFATIAKFMAQTTHQCKRVYESGCSTDSERKHMSRFHTRPRAGTTSAPSSRKPADVSATAADFYIEVSPGTYAISAALPESQQQTQLIHINAGESINLTFNL